MFWLLAIFGLAVVLSYLVANRIVDKGNQSLKPDHMVRILDVTGARTTSGLIGGAATLAASSQQASDDGESASKGKESPADDVPNATGPDIPQVNE